MPLAARPATGCHSRACPGRSATAKRHLLVGIRLLMDGWHVPALPNKCFKQTSQADMLSSRADRMHPITILTDLNTVAILTIALLIRLSHNATNLAWVVR